MVATAPAITSFSPASGKAGTVVTVTGGRTKVWIAFWFKSDASVSGPGRLHR